MKKSNRISRTRLGSSWKIPTLLQWAIVLPGTQKKKQRLITDICWDSFKERWDAFQRCTDRLSVLAVSNINAAHDQLVHQTGEANIIFAHQIEFVLLITRHHTFLDEVFRTRITEWLLTGSMCWVEQVVCWTLSCSESIQYLPTARWRNVLCSRFLTVCPCPTEMP